MDIIDIKPSRGGGATFATEVLRDWQIRVGSLTVRLAPLLIMLACACSCRNPDRHQRRDQTLDSLRQIASIVVAIHDRDPKILKNRELHEVLSIASDWQVLSIGEFQSGRFAKDAWGRPFNTSYATTNDGEILTVASSGPNGTSEAGAGDDLSVSIAFKRAAPAEITIHE